MRLPGETVARDEAVTVPCPRCLAPPGEQCRLARPRRSGQRHRDSCHLERHREFQGIVGVDFVFNPSSSKAFTSSPVVVGRGPGGGEDVAEATMFPQEPNAPKGKTPAQMAVGSYCDGVRDKTGRWPDKGMTAQAGKRIKELLAAGYDLDIVAEAAGEAGRRGFGPTGISRAAQRLQASRSSVSDEVAWMKRQQEMGPLR